MHIWIISVLSIFIVFVTGSSIVVTELFYKRVQIGFVSLC